MAYDIATKPVFNNSSGWTITIGGKSIRQETEEDSAETVGKITSFIQNMPESSGTTSATATNNVSRTTQQDQDFWNGTVFVQTLKSVIADTVAKIS
jgi:hypothetical protein